MQYPSRERKPRGPPGLSKQEALYPYTLSPYMVYEPQGPFRVHVGLKEGGPLGLCSDYTGMVRLMI